MYIRLLTAILLSALLTATVSSQTKDSAKDTESAKASEPKYPEKVEGKNLQEWLKTATSDPDPAVREQALLAIANFSPAEVRKVCGKILVARLGGGGERELDNGVKIALINFIGDLGLEDPHEIVDATRILASLAGGGGGPNLLRLSALQALGKFGPKAYGHIKDLDVILNDPSYVIRQTLAKTLGQIGWTETTGPSAQALGKLGTLAVKDSCAVVRLTALQSICSMGPPWSAVMKPGAWFKLSDQVIIALKNEKVPESVLVKLNPLKDKEFSRDDFEAEIKKLLNANETKQFLSLILNHPKPGAKEPPPPDEKAAQETINLMKSRIGGKKVTNPSESDKQIELWCRLVIIRFGFTQKEEFDEQLKGIAAHLSDREAAVKIQALGILGLLGENAAPKLPDVVKLLDGGGLADHAAALHSKQAVRVAALHTLGAIGGKAIDPILKIIDNPKEYTEIRIAALDALAMLGEKGEAGREILKTIITDDANLKGEGVELLAHALTALGSMGVKARGSIPELIDLTKRLDIVREKRLASPEHQMMLKSLKLLLDKLPPDEQVKLKEKILENPEDQFKQGVENTIRYIKESTPEHPGGEHKKP